MSRARDWLINIALPICGFVIVVLLPYIAHGAEIPREAQQYRHILTREAHLHWGLDAPVARLAAQIHQESAWRADAKSPYADGLAQFTPATAEWIAQVYPRALANPAPYSPGWAIRALVIYDRHLYHRVTAATPCDAWAFTLSAYNGGEGWRKRDQALCASVPGCDPSRWWGHVEHYSPRAAWAFRENRDYPQRILLRWEPIYIRAGWPGKAVCEQT